MLKTIQTLRDFLDEEQLEQLPGNLKVESCILLTKYRKDKENMFRKYIYVFGKDGSLIGKIDKQ